MQCTHQYISLLHGEQEQKRIEEFSQEIKLRHSKNITDTDTFTSNTQKCGRYFKNIFHPHIY